VFKRRIVIGVAVAAGGGGRDEFLALESCVGVWLGWGVESFCEDG